MIENMPEPLKISFIGIAGAIILKLIEKLLGKGSEEHTQNLELRKELREEVKYLNEKIDKLEDELDVIKKKYWEDVELIFHLKSENLRLQSILTEMKDDKQTFVDDTGLEGRRKTDEHFTIRPKEVILDEE